MRRFAVLLLSFVAAGCSGGVEGDVIVDPTAPLIARDLAALFQTDSLRYTLKAFSGSYDGTIGVVFTNGTPDTAFIVNCAGSTSLALEKLVDGGWVRAWSPVLPACLSPPIVIAPGRQYRSDVRIFSGYVGSNLYPQFSITDITGIYRIVWDNVLRTYQDRLPFGEPVGPDRRVSNRFELIAPPRP
jgi:hypothetical protein